MDSPLWCALRETAAARRAIRLNVSLDGTAVPYVSSQGIAVQVAQLALKASIESRLPDGRFLPQTVGFSIVALLRILTEFRQ